VIKVLTATSFEVYHRDF